MILFRDLNNLNLSDECVSTKLRVTENRACFILVILNCIPLYTHVYWALSYSIWYNFPQLYVYISECKQIYRSIQFKTAYPSYWYTPHLTLKPVYRPELKKTPFSVYFSRQVHFRYPRQPCHHSPQASALKRRRWSLGRELRSCRYLICFERKSDIIAESSFFSRSLIIL